MAEKKCGNCDKPESNQALCDHDGEEWCLDCMRQTGHCISCDAYIPHLVEDYFNYEDDRCPDCVKKEDGALYPKPQT